MLLSDFWTLVDDVFGAAYSRTLAREMSLTALGDRTAMAALEAGTPPRDVWHALCDAMDIPEHVRIGGATARSVPPRR